MNRFEIKAIRNKLTEIGAVRTYVNFIKSTNHRKSIVDIISFFKEGDYTFIISGSYDNVTANGILNHLQSQYKENKYFFSGFIDHLNKKHHNTFLSEDEQEFFHNTIFRQIRSFSDTPFFTNLNLHFSDETCSDLIWDVIEEQSEHKFIFSELYHGIFIKFGFDMHSLFIQENINDDVYIAF